MTDTFVMLVNDLTPCFIYVFVGTVIAELIILGYATWFATPEEKQKARKISRDALQSTAQRIPLVPMLTTPTFESAAVTGPYAIMPLNTILGFMLLWYFCIPALWVCYQLAMAPPHIQEAFGLMMRSIS